MRIAQLSDCHLFSDINQTAYNEINPYTTLCRVIELVKQVQPDMLFFTGDISGEQGGDQSEQSYRHLTRLLSPFAQVKVRMIPGNHDDPELLTNVFGSEVVRLSGYEDLSDKASNWRIHYLNSFFEGAKGSVDESRLLQLEQDIVSAPDQSHLIAVHHHPLDTIAWMDKHDWVNRHKFLQLMCMLPGSIRVIYGHVHHASDRVFCGQFYYSCPSTCWQWAQTDSFGVSNEQPGFRVIELSEQGQWHSYIERVNG